MKSTKLPLRTQTKLRRITENSRQNPEYEVRWLMPHFSKGNLMGCFHELDGDKAVGIDRKTKEEYGLELEKNIEGLIARMKSMSYRPQAMREVRIPKADGGERSLAIACLEDKIVQLMMAKLLESLYEPVFREVSYGFRPDRSCHQAIGSIQHFLYTTGPRCHVVDLDMKNFFGSIPHDQLLEILGKRIKDEKFLRYVSRILKSGVMTRAGYEPGERGTPQGSIASPILANIYCHYVIDEWFEDVVRLHLRGKAIMARYCDDMVFCFSSGRDVEKFWRALAGRLEKFGLELNRAKSKTVTFDKDQFRAGVIQGSFDFLGFRFSLKRSLRVYWIPVNRTIG